MNIPPRSGFGTTNASLVGLPASRDAAPSWFFAAGAPDKTPFAPVEIEALVPSAGIDAA